MPLKSLQYRPFAGDMHGPQFLIDYDVIIVTVNYRLGPLGQLSLDTGLVSGNQVNKRLKDLILWEETHKQISIRVKN